MEFVHSILPPSIQNNTIISVDDKRGTILSENSTQRNKDEMKEGNNMEEPLGYPRASTGSFVFFILN